MMTQIIKLQNPNKTQPSALRVAMGYRGINQTELCKNVKGVSQSNLSKYLKGYYGCLSESKLKEIMIFLEFPFEFLYNEFKPLVTSKGIIK